MAADPHVPDPTALGFTPIWFAAGVVTPESAADFVRLAAASPGRSSRFWRWAAFRDFAEEQGPLTRGQCRAAYQLGESEPDAGLGTAILCAVLHQSACPPELITCAAASDRAAVRRTARRRMPPG